MRYIINDKGYVTDISFGCALVVNGSECTEYTGTVPNEYSNLEEWYAEEELTLWRWKIVNGNLTLDPNATAPEEGDWGKQLLNDFIAGEIEEIDSDFSGEIRDYLFAGLESLKIAKFPNVHTVGRYAFQNCTGLALVELPQATYFDDYCFSGVKVDYLELPALTHETSVYNLTDNASFTTLSLPALKTGCPIYGTSTSIVTLYVPELEYDLRCDNLTSLETVYAPKLIEHTESSGAFSYCTNLKNVYMESLQIAHNEMFRNCTSIKRIDLPSTVTQITGQPVRGCTSLETLIIRSTTVPTCSYNNPFYESPIASGTAYIYVPKASLEAYKTSKGFSSYASQIRAIEDYPDITAKQVYQHVTQ